MSEGIAGVHARIAEIQQRFGPAPTAPLVASTALSAAMPTGTEDFASLLADATDTRPGTATTTATIPTTAPASGATQTFLDAALGQAGDPYVWGSSAAPTDADPDAFDCSELVKWAGRRAGVTLPDGSWLQYLKLKEQGALIPVDQAMQTPGALLFSFSSEPQAGQGRPNQAHVAISLGDGRTIEARGKEYGVGTFEAADRFEYGAIIPGL
ncbi:MAG: NlpC/P60 family protein [Actinomycetota bacterium]|nr:NlpC/P60 family protein [Actinomycetota bacterium]